MNHSPARLNSIADDAAGDVAEVSFHYANPTAAGDNETGIARQALTFSAAGSAGAHPTQVAADGRAWSQLFDVTIPDGTTVTHLATRDSGGDVLDWWEVLPAVGPRTWRIAVPIESRNLA